jgi:aromatic amino acid aminotransferase I
MQVDWRQHPLAESWSLTEIENQIFMAAVDKGALVTCGSWFFSDSTLTPQQMFFRATFAAAPADQIDAAIQRFGEAVRQVFGLQNKLNGSQ